MVTTLPDDKIAESQIELKVTDSAAEAPASSLPSVDPINAGSPPSERHSLFHGIKKAQCNSKWALMPGSETVRECRVCKARVYKVDGLGDEEFAALIAENETQIAPSTQPLYRRTDGTMMVAKGKCERIQALLAVTALVFLIVGIVLPQAFHIYVFGPTLVNLPIAVAVLAPMSLLTIYPSTLTACALT